MPRITQISPSVPKIKTKLKVAAYARVSVETEMLMHSLSAQVSYYSSFIQKNPEWEYAGVYADEGITGTSTLHRDEFNRLVADCEAGKIDMVLVKSISRFARDTVARLSREEANTEQRRASKINPRGSSSCNHLTRDIPGSPGNA